MRHTRPIRIVVIDDDTSFRRLVALAVEEDDRFVLVGEAAGGLEALGVVGRGDPDVVSLDLHLPSVDGLALLRMLLDQHEDLVVVVVTGDDEQIEQALAGGATAVFVKGAPLAEVLDLIDRHHGSKADRAGAG